MAKGKIETDGDTAASRRGRPRSAETTNAILQSAYTLMATTGLAATSIDAVARHSNVSKMTIYKWWPSREALLIDAFLNHASLMLPLPNTGVPASIVLIVAAATAGLGRPPLFSGPINRLIPSERRALESPHIWYMN